jgi:2-oxoglutarate ferredoxin oxidoreductase subunit gamma
MLNKSIFAGFGGQGVLLMGVCFANAAMNEGKHVTYLPSYGAEVRGGTANCTVSVSTDEIASPIASSPDFVVVMNAPSLARFQNLIRPGGVFVINSTLVEQKLSRTDVGDIRVPCGSIAEELGSMRIANMVMLGAFAAASDLVSFRGILDAVHTIAGSKKKELAELNEKAVTVGYEYVKQLMKTSDKKKPAAHKTGAHEEQS